MTKRKVSKQLGNTYSLLKTVDVAWAALRARSEPTVISGPKNKMFASMSRLMSRKRLVTTMGKMMPPT